eukprot:TRINITY_DN2539_c0_g2_i1.p1 TRINITY_DN2539_c0_g2~~TRINITY_DN2539_c0_g2_i1.p1  ORF type:complete len:168 (+),score=25.27 TRINITY_DN2539_c0_g2_i1:65-568(+)
MPYTIFVASDVFHRKVNLELEFPFAPTLADLTRQTEQAFTAEQNAQRPDAGIPPFQVLKFQVVDEATDEWVEVFEASRIKHHDQFYCFQPHSTCYTDSQGHIPAARKPVGFQFVPSAPEISGKQQSTVVPTAPTLSMIDPPKSNQLNQSNQSNQNGRKKGSSCCCIC